MIRVYSVVSNSLRPHGLWPARLLCPWDFLGKNIGVGCHSLLHEIFPTQGSNPGLLRWQADSLPSMLPGKPKEDFCYCCCSVTQSCPTLCDPMDCSLPGSSVHGIFQARILEWVAISFSEGSSQPKDRTCVFCVGRWILYL